MTNGTVNTACMTTSISNMDSRNSVIVYIIRQLISQGRKILLLSSRKRQLHTISDLLDEAGIKHPMTGHYITYGFYYGKTGMSRVAHKALLVESAKCDVVLGIDVIAKEGLDIPDRNTLIFATPPGTEVEQPVGRILRRFHKDINPMVIDLVDNTGNYMRHSKTRDAWYADEGYVIQSHTCNLDAQNTDALFTYIHTKMPAPERQCTPPPEAPNMEILLLTQSKDIRVNKPKPQKPKIAAHPPLEGPTLKSCLLADNSGLVSKRAPRGPDLHVFIE
jgi:superfamily II DNA or RNA helicase